MNKKAISILAALICVASVSKAQYIEDAIRVSQPDNGSTARFKAMGNVGTALGGDLSSITGNPAGLGFFNTSDAGLTLNYFNDKNDNKYYGTSTSSSTDRFTISQAGVVFNMPIHYRNNRPTSGWLNFNIGIGYSRTNDFNSQINFNGENNNSSYTNLLSESASVDPVFDEWGIDSWLLDFNPNNNTFYTSASESLTNDQANTDEQKGSQSQTNFSFGANYNNSFYIGASIGLANFNYESRRRFDEFGDLKTAAEFNAIDPGSVFLDPTNADLLSAPYELSFSSLQKTHGTGFNGTLGVIFKPDRMFQIGLSATTPTWYTVTDDYSMTFDSWIDPTSGEPTLEYHSDEELYYDEYDMRTPYRLNAGIAAIFEEGLISADIEYVDYTSMKITTSDFTNDTESANIISEDYKGAVNFKLGGEYRFSPSLLVRAGYNYRGNPYNNISSTKQTVSAGIGYRISNMYIDLTYMNEGYDLSYTPYQSAEFPVSNASIKNVRNNALLTVGFKF